MSNSLAIGTAALLLSAACGGLTSAPPSTVVYQADYPSYGTAGDLAQQATLIVEARFNEEPRVEMEFPSDASDITDPQLNPNAGVPEQEQLKDRTGPVVTVHRATVEKVHKGPVKPGDIIEVKEMGGTLDGVRYENADSAPIATGRSYLLFLETYPDSPASLLNPLQAKYELDADGNPASAPGNTITLTGVDLAKIIDK
ncbi:hypothetical protein C1I95_01780 [Micromonospora craterilacus]|uniref:Lipoprotein n=1 Tax=Micromonospora craterilacus TaxID=1655439 RepID=A0A2W2EMI7_9ACTN|nr:hypothetical protein [Micromonospora craterilacus]PZG23931.1 hypothetical protein C1I95_01780 [Micromonospora craterilacus]